METPHEAFTNPPDSPCKPASSPDSSDDPAAPETAVAPVETDETEGSGTAASAAGQALNQALAEARCEPGSPLAAWVRLAGKEGDDFRHEWAAMNEEWDARIRTGEAFNREHFQVRWDLAGPDYGEWIGHGAGLPAEPSRPGEFSVGANRKQILNGIFPAGVYTHLLSDKHNGVIQSPRFTIDTNFISLSVLGSDFSFAQLIVENYAVPRGLIFHMRHVPKTDRMEWVQWDVAYWKGFTAYIELATRDDVTNIYYDPKKFKTQPEERTDGRSAIGASRNSVSRDEGDAQEKRVRPCSICSGARRPAHPPDLARRMGRRLVEAIEAWRDGGASELQAAYLDAFVRADLLPRSRDRLPSGDALLTQYREIEAQVPVPRRAPSVLDEAAPDHPFLVRGDQDAHGAPVPPTISGGFGQRSLHRSWPGAPGTGPGPCLTRQPADGPGDGQPHLAVPVRIRNRPHHGQLRKVGRPAHSSGTPGSSGQPVRGGGVFHQEHGAPTGHVPGLSHEQRGIRRFSPGGSGQSAPPACQPETTGRRGDPRRHAARLREPGSEAVRTLHSRLPRDREAQEQRTRAVRGPWMAPGRRSIYQEIRRNAYNPFLEAFGLPKPASTLGQRDQTNVPAQSLTLLNSPFAWHQAEAWGKHLAAGEGNTATSRIHHMFLKALGREPSVLEAARAEQYLSMLIAERKTREHLILTDRRIWTDLAHALFNLKNFIYVQ